MGGYQPRHDTDRVWWNGTQVNAIDWQTTQLGVRITTIHGWDDRPDVRDTRELRSGQDGEYADTLYLGGRTITIEGEVYGSTWADLQTRKRALAALFAPSSTERLLKISLPSSSAPTGTYAEAGMADYERVTARVVEAIQFGDTLDPRCQAWQVVLRASDPRVYADVATSTDSGTSGTAARTVTVDQGGSYETPATLTVTGPTGSTWSVTEPSSGLVLTVDGLTLAAAELATADLRDRTLTFAGPYEASRLNAVVSPVGLWMLDETSGTTADNSQGTSARDGTYTGGYTQNQSGFASGIASVDLNGSTGYISIPYVAELHPLPVTYEGWFYFDSTAGTQTLFDGVTSNRGFRLDWTGTAFRTTVGIGASSETKTHALVGTITTGTWYRFLLRADGPQYLLIVMNATGTTYHVTSNSTAPAGTPYLASTSGGHRVGATLAGASFFNGRMAAFAIYTSATYAGLIPITTYPLDNGSTSSAYQYLDASSTTWANLGTASSTYTLSSSGLNTGSKLNVSYRDARL